MKVLVWFCGVACLIQALRHLLGCPTFFCLWILRHVVLDGHRPDLRGVCLRRGGEQHPVEQVTPHFLQDCRSSFEGNCCQPKKILTQNHVVSEMGVSMGDVNVKCGNSGLRFRSSAGHSSFICLRIFCVIDTCCCMCGDLFGVKLKDKGRTSKAKG